MQAENAYRVAIGASAAYSYDDFMAIQNKYHIGWNAVIEYLGD